MAKVCGMRSGDYLLSCCIVNGYNTERVILLSVWPFNIDIVIFMMCEGPEHNRGIAAMGVKVASVVFLYTKRRVGCTSGSFVVRLLMFEGNPWA